MKCCYRCMTDFTVAVANFSPVDYRAVCVSSVEPTTFYLFPQFSFALQHSHIRWLLICSPSLAIGLQTFRHHTRRHHQCAVDELILRLLESPITDVMFAITEQYIRILVAATSVLDEVINTSGVRQM
ncbi:hypothetical protein CSKR_105440 [Clonorchis sinensis]|uniref:Uncharacterized protein n=1 Tax=Clonorchis sinensis TaxID=79923 RepID=A0A3R7CD38_CLOSI|nr:hypothetical protein CSKR_105440 [Clonorchis sinensis]